MGGKYGTKETKEVVTLGKVVTLAILAEVKKDGFQVKDLGAFLKSPEFEKAVVPAVENVELVASEVTELDFFDGLALSKHAYACADEILDALKATVKKTA